MKPMEKAVYFAGTTGNGKTTFALLSAGFTLWATKWKIEEIVLG